MKRLGRIVTPKGPRFSKKSFVHHIITEELFSKFKKNYPEFNISFREFKRLWIEVLAPEIREQVINNPLGFVTSFYCGELKYQWLSYKPKSIDIPYKSKTGEEVPLVNMNHGNKVPKIIWERRNAVRYNPMLQFYGFDPHREMFNKAKLKQENANVSLRVARATLGGKKYGLK